MRRIQGMTFSGMLVIGAVVVVIAIFAMKITPIYLGHYQVEQAVSNLKDVSSERFTHDMAYNAHQIRRTLMNQFYIDNVVGIKPKNIVIKPISYKKFQINIDYNVEKKMIANISILVHFKVDQEVEINAP